MHELLGQDEDSKDKLKLSAYKYLSVEHSLHALRLSSMEFPFHLV